jgi:glycerophosphoryl diester phosphodiesterase
MTKIVGHRGAKALELENTIKGFKRAKELGVDAIELDVLSTKDGKFVVCHDNDLKRLSGRDACIDKLTYSELAEIKLANNETIPLLYDVLSVTGDVPIVIDLKTDLNLPEMFAILDNFPGKDITIVTWLKHTIKTCKKLRPDIPAFVQRRFSPFGLIRSVNKYGADGLNLNFYWLNPITYRSAMKKGFKIQVYTVNNVHVARVLKKLYPGIWICTNHPDKFLAALSDKHIQA